MKKQLQKTLTILACIASMAATPAAFAQENNSEQTGGDVTLSELFNIFEKTRKKTDETIKDTAKVLRGPIELVPKTEKQEVKKVGESKTPQVNPNNAKSR